MAYLLRTTTRRLEMRAIRTGSIWTIDCEINQREAIFPVLYHNSPVTLVSDPTALSGGLTWTNKGISGLVRQ
jgi:hypothetical protein